MLITEQYPETLENSPGTLAEFLGSDVKGKHLTYKHFWKFVIQSLKSQSVIENVWF